MFEDSTFESTSSIHIRSRGWIFATFAWNSAVMIALILFPLLNPSALPGIMGAILMVAPRSSQPAPPLQQQTTRVPHITSEMMTNQLRAPSKIPPTKYIPSQPEPPAMGTAAPWETWPQPHPATV